MDQRKTAKTIGVFFSDPAPDGYPLNKEYYRMAYRELAEEVRARGGRLLVVRGTETFLGGNRFSRAWELTADGLLEHPGPIDVDRIYDKGYTFVPDADSRMLNDPAMDRICTDKFETYRLFPAACPATEIVRSARDVDAALASIPSDRVVVKPLDGEEGRGVAVLDRADVAAHIPSYPYLVQEFLDLSGGIPGLVDGTHDLRITSINGDIILCFIRTPPEGSFLANVAQGGRKIEVPRERIPDGARALWQTVDADYARFPRRVYSVDMGRRADGAWKIIELNAKPGCTCREEGPDSARFVSALADALVS